MITDHSRYCWKWLAYYSISPLIPSPGPEVTTTKMVPPTRIPSSPLPQQMCAWPARSSARPPLAYSPTPPGPFSHKCSPHWIVQSHPHRQIRTCTSVYLTRDKITGMR